ncbi:cation diffusion facilitator family transporter [Dasania sp. GY-MA-18]|uniref:Cation diffusion facilitator family transporter n=1 Tax=Dasania phycosphaerae TaxID=2950436 RepID=A0A9J6RJ27_9GAMM|nr:MULTISPECIES: cation diffusion facilitator family transporter [Dasania]MCR8922000.1 cation diffusion facilitator family transporter [Dasania sp. GY-MA-18]MCZ0864428.1 cation diffusion facilitator family transporter [Dasania phycosphaerae]MCZ0868156.1 cation diffusion facilitator family transporter [Dasania phycosphaerae]
MPCHNQAKREQKALLVSLYGVVFFIVLALGFAVFTNSGAILFDGIYSLIAFATALITLKVAKLAEKPDDELFHFGYTSLEPTLNLFKSLIVIVACVYAGVEALMRLLAGGTEAEYGWAVVYGVLSTVGCFVVAGSLKKMGRDTRSGLLAVEAKTWFVDGLFSLSVLLGFIVAWVINQTEYADLAPYVDPLLLMILVVLALPIPGRILLDSLREVILMAPPAKVVDEIEAKLFELLGHIPHQLIELRVTKRGRNTYVLVHLVVSDEFKVNSIKELDQIRYDTMAAIKVWNPEVVLDILFVQDLALAE